MPKENIIAIGFDVGSKKIGVAVGQSLTLQAKAVDLLAAEKGIPKKEAIKKLLNDWRPTHVIVGIPLTIDGKEQFSTKFAKNFIDFIKDFVTLPIIEIDERYTTKQARSELFEEGGYQHLIKSNIDGYAAKIMIETWLRENTTI